MNSHAYRVYKEARDLMEKANECCDKDHSEAPLFMICKNLIEQLHELSPNYKEYYEQENLNFNHSYLGDGVYSFFDGYGIWLRTGDHRGERCNDKIYLEPDVFNALSLFNKRVRGLL